MAQKSDLDELIKRITLYETSLLFHGYVRPFLILYFICFFVWYFFYGLSEHFEEGMIAIAVIGVLQILTYLSCHWSINVRCLLSYKKESNILKANYVKVVPAQNNGSPELVKLCKVELKDKQTMPDSSEILGFCTQIKISESIDELYKLMKKERVKHYNIWFEFQKTKYIFNRKTKKFEGLTFPDNYNLNVYQNWKGLDEEGVAKATDQYGQNKQEMVVPSFFELFAERATAPFFVFQVFCIGLWCLDDYWYYSLFSLVTLITFEYFIVLQQIKNISYIRNMGNKSYKISVYRNTQWIICESSELVPGDILSIGQGEVPCDALLLRGSCIVNESMLTGESVPQMKVPIEFLDSDEQLDMNQHNRPHVLFGGTKVLQYTPPLKTLPGLKSPDNGCIAYVLRTGFNTSQGKLLRTILFGVKRVTANNLETFYFILFLLVFAIGASTNVWIKGIEDPKKKWYKLFLECCLILTSVVPPELPMVLSFAVNTSLLALTKFNIFCTEPFRIPLAGKVEICCFDKTGTLTSNNLTVEGIAGLFDGDMQTKSIPASTIQVLACCHSLVQLDNELVGDPLEKVMFEHVDFILSEDDCVKPRQGDMSSVKIHHRFHFSSSVKRMSVIASYIPHGLAEPSYFFATKGAPEILKPMFSRIPQNYDEIYLALTRRGARVLALGRKDLGQTPNNNGRLLSIDALERDLQFKGFLVLSCPLKSDSKAIIKTILDATYHVVMITGDAPFTACHVAKELKFTRHRLTLIFTPPAATESHWWWVSIDGTTKVPGVMTKEENIQILIKNFNLCLTGEGMVYLLSKHPTYFRRLLPYICVFARVAPKQKEKVITELKTQGFHTLMCGDGTNDVGALKHADVGVAIFSAVWQKIKPKETEDDNASNGKVGQRSDTRSKESSHENGHIPAESNKGNDEQNNTHLVKLGDASIAAPFTSKLSSIQCVFHIIKQGRCTLVTTLQMFKILALNALILAYCQSVLYLNGIKFSDLQATFQGLLLAACFLCISNSKPLKTLSKERPLPNIFNLYTVLTVLLQFAIHFQSLVYLVDEATARSPPRSENFVDLDSKFKPSLLNSTVYITSMSLQVSTFAINYRGNPFMVNLSKNKPLLSTIAVSALAIFFLLIGFPHNLVDYFYVVHFPFEFQHIVVSTLYLDFVFAFVVDRVTLHFFGYGKLRVA